jgi:hypothetical protein
LDADFRIRGLDRESVCVADRRRREFGRRI